MTCAGRPQLPFVAHTPLNMETPRLRRRLEGLQTPRVGRIMLEVIPRKGLSSWPLI